jgi:Uma2 family endonuclease
MRERPSEPDLLDLRFLTTEGFLAWEQEQEVRHELIDGMVWAMPGGTIRHGRMITGIVRELGNRLLGGPCLVLSGETRIRSPKGEILYPDVWVRCGANDEDVTEVADPVVAIEVLSPSTRTKDLVRKRRIYQTISTMRHIGFVEPSRVEVEHLCRVADGPWRGETLTALDDLLDLAAIGVRLPLRAIYARVDAG